MMASRRRTAIAWVAILAAGLGACDQGPRGPREVLVAVRGDPALGAAVLDITWTGMESVDGGGDTQAYAAAVSGSSDRHRVVLVDPVGGELRFTVSFLDSGDAPVFTIVAAADTSNQPLSVGDLRVVVVP